MNIAIIFAGGSGTRMKTHGLPKQFLKVEGKPIIIKTLEYFEKNDEIDKIYIACKPDWIDYLNEELQNYNIKKVAKVVPGGETGQDSIYNGLSAARKENPEDSIVLIHDGVRPFITQELITQNIRDVKEFGSSITSTPCYETAIVSRDGENIQDVPSRDIMYTAQAPQCFFLGDILKVHEEVRNSEQKYNGIVDSCNLMRSRGYNVHLTLGPRNNIKVTTPTDYYVIQALYKYEEDEEKARKELNPILEGDIEKILDAKIDFKKLENSTVLITGASGMIGSYLMYTLVNLNDLKSYNIKIVALVRNKEKIPPYFKNREDIYILEQDVCDKINYNDRVDYIIHAASPASPKIMREKPVDTIMANTIGTINTLKLAKKNNVKCYLYISSREVYGEPYEWQNEFDENTYGFIDPLLPRSCYPEGKRAAENMCISYKEQYGLNVKIARPAHTYGPGMSIYDGRVQADFLKNVINNENIVMKSTGEAIRTYTYIRDVISALFLVLLDSDDVVYNMADENSKISIKELAELLINLYPEKKLKLVMDIDKDQKGCAPFKLGTINSDKIKKLGWTPTVTLEEGFRRTVEYIQLEIKNGKKNI